MKKSLTSRVSAAATLAALTAAMLFAPLQANAGGGAFSQGHGVKCAWVLVSTSIDPVTGATIENYAIQCFQNP